MENPVPAIGKNVGFSTEGEVAKLFVGQIPKNYTEQQVRELMEPFGPISELNIIKDKETMCSRGRVEKGKHSVVPPFCYTTSVFIGPRATNESFLHMLCVNCYL